MNGNDFVKLALRSPLQAMMGDTMLITVTGRKTGRKITLPVGFYREGNTLWIISSRDRTWWRNIGTGAEVDIHLHGRDLAGFGEVVREEGAVAAQMGEYAKHMPGSARFLGLRMENGVANCEDVERVAKERLFVRVCIVG